MDKNELLEISLTDKLQYILKNLKYIPDEFWTTRNNPNSIEDGIQYINLYEISEGGYEWSAQRLDLIRDGTFRYGFDSGCSCYGSWESEFWDDKPIKCKNLTKKSIELTIDEITKILYDDINRSSYSYDEMDASEKNKKWFERDNIINDLYILLQKEHKPEDIFLVQNTEVRRCLMKEINYNKIIKILNPEIISSDIDKLGKERQLIEFKFDRAGRHVVDRYIKVEDSSTNRVYLLGVPENIKTPHEGIAWSFDIEPELYTPQQET